MPLYVVATPIGNLEDVSRRAARVLSESALVLAEDTRRTRVLLDALGVRVRVRTYHDRGREDAAAEALSLLAGGGNVSLVSDAGTPAISDPGSELVAACVAAGYAVVPVPGPSTLTAFLSCAGLPTELFQFVGFAPRRAGELRDGVSAWAAYAGTTVFFESPNRAVATLACVAEVCPSRPVVVGRELTKIHEEWVRGSAAEVAAKFASRDRVLGEVVVGLAGEARARVAGEEELEGWLRELLAAGVGTKVASAVVARRLGVRASDAYARALVLARESAARGDEG